MIPEVLPVGLVLIFGRPGVAKTTLSAQLEHAVAAGVKIAGYAPEDPGRCLIAAFAVRDASLDDVFLALTGHATETTHV